MKYILDNIRWLVAVLIWLTLPAMAEVGDTLTFDFNELEIENITANGDTFLLPTLPGCELIDQIGAPMLPVTYIRMSVPYNATNFRVSSSASGSSTTLSQWVYPNPVPIATNDSVIEQPDVVIDSTIYMTSAFWPPNAAELVGEGFYMGDNHIVTIAVYPTRYNPVTSRLRKMSTVRLKVSYDLGNTPDNMLVRRGGDLRQKEQQTVQTMVVNPEQVETFAMQPAQAQHMPAHGLLPDSVLTDSASYSYGGVLYGWGDRARYLIVTTRELAPSFKRLAALKRQKGYSVQIKCIEDILADPRVQQGDKCKLEGGGYSYINDDAGKLRQYLKLAYSYDNTQFVLLAGKNIPYRYGLDKFFSKNDTIYQHHFIPTDWYFADITSLWGIGTSHNYSGYCIQPGNESFAELYVGRITSDNKNEIYSYIKKLLCYELDPGHGDNSYLKRALFTEGFRFNYVTSVASEYSMFDKTLMIQNNVNDQYPTGQDIITAQNSEQFGFLSVAGHGNPHGIATSGKKISTESGSYNQIYSGFSALTEYITRPSSGALDEMNNTNKPGIFYSTSCVNMPFDTFIRYDGVPYVGWNLAESYILGEGYGGVAYLGNTRDGIHILNNPYAYSPKLQMLFASVILSGIYNVGAVEANSKSMYCSNDLYGSKAYFTQVHNLMGEPEFEIWTDAPQTLNGTVQSYDNSILVSEIDIEREYTIGVNDGLSQHLLSTASSSFSINSVNPNSTIMIYQHNKIPFIAPLLLQNERIERSQYIIANDVVAGRYVDANRNPGDLIIASGNNFEIETKGTVTLAPGFVVEKGALFSVSQSDY